MAEIERKTEPPFHARENGPGHVRPGLYSIIDKNRQTTEIDGFSTFTKEQAEKLLEVLNGKQ